VNVVSVDQLLQYQQDKTRQMGISNVLDGFIENPPIRVVIVVRVWFYTCVVLEALQLVSGWICKERDDK